MLNYNSLSDFSYKIFELFLLKILTIRDDMILCRYEAVKQTRQTREGKDNDRFKER
jgi:hypothetical protein